MTGKSPNTKDTKYTKGERRQFHGRFPFVTVVSFVVENVFPVRNGSAKNNK